MRFCVGYMLRKRKSDFVCVIQMRSFLEFLDFSEVCLDYVRFWNFDFFVLEIDRGESFKIEREDVCESGRL